jgi:hypothetical protein
MNVVTHILIRESDNFITKLFQNFCADGIIFRLFCFKMRVSININAQLGFGAIEINDKPIKRMLPAELVNQVTIPQMLP